MSGYSDSIDSFATVSAGDVITSAGQNDLAAAIVAVESTLGVNPQGAYSSVADAIADKATIESIQTDGLIFAADTGTTNTFAIELSPAPPAYTIGQMISFTALNSNTGASTIAVNGATAAPLTRQGGAALTGGEIAAGQVVVAVYDGTQFQMVSTFTPTLDQVRAPLGAVSFNGQNLQNLATPVSSTDAATKAYVDAHTTGSGALYAIDTGSANAYAIAPSPPITSYAAGQQFVFKAANANTAASTLAVSGIATPQTITKFGATALAAGDILAGQVVAVTYDGTQFQMMDPASTSGGASYTAGTGLTLASNQFSLSTPVAVSSGGTGAATLTGLVKGNGTSAFSAATAGTDYLTPANTQSQVGTYATDTGAANAYAIAPSPAITSYAAGQHFVFQAVHANTGASTLNVSSLGTKSLTKFGATALVSGDIAANQMVSVVYDGTEFQVLDPGSTSGGATYTAGTGLSLASNQFSLTTPVTVSNGGTGAATLTGLVKGSGTSALSAATAGTDYMTPGNVQNQLVTFATDTGTANAYAIAPSPAIGTYTAGQQFAFKAVNANTGASTLNVSGLGTKSLTKFGTSALVSGDIVAGQMVSVMYDGAEFQLMDPSVQATTVNQTWNASGTAFYGQSINITNTASAAASRILELQSSGTEVFGVDAHGGVVSNSGTLTANDPGLSITQTWNNASVAFVPLQVNVNNTASSTSSLLFSFLVNGFERFFADVNNNFNFAYTGPPATLAGNIGSVQLNDGTNHLIITPTVLFTNTPGLSLVVTGWTEWDFRQPLYFNNMTPNGDVINMQQGTATVNSPFLDMGQTWNASGVAFNGLKMTITNTASAATSRLATFQVGGTEVFGVDTSGTITSTGGCSHAVAAKTAAYTLTTADYTVFVNPAGTTGMAATLPVATGSGREYVVFNNGTGTGTVVITPNGTNTINGAATYTLASSANKFARIVDGASGHWFVVGSN